MGGGGGFAPHPLSFRASGFRGFGTLPVEFMPGPPPEEHVGPGGAIEAVLSVSFLLTA